MASRRSARGSAAIWRTRAGWPPRSRRRRAGAWWRRCRCRRCACGTSRRASRATRSTPTRGRGAIASTRPASPISPPPSSTDAGWCASRWAPRRPSAGTSRRPGARCRTRWRERRNRRDDHVALVLDILRGLLGEVDPTRARGRDRPRPVADARAGPRQPRAGRAGDAPRAGGRRRAGRDGARRGRHAAPDCRGHRPGTRPPPRPRPAARPRAEPGPQPAAAARTPRSGDRRADAGRGADVAGRARRRSRPHPAARTTTAPTR